MVRVIIEHKTKDPARLIELIRELRNEAMKQPGYITAETLVSTEDTSNILVITTWQSVKYWDAWDKSEARGKLTQEIKELLTEPYKVSTYHYQMVRENRVWSTF